MASAVALAIFSGKIIFIICRSETTAVVSDLLFHGEKLWRKVTFSFSIHYFS